MCSGVFLKVFQHTLFLGPRSHPAFLGLLETFTRFFVNYARKVDLVDTIITVFKVVTVIKMISVFRVFTVITDFFDY